MHNKKVYDKHYFQLKGESSEKALNELAFKTFLREWCYPNPKGIDGKEICDLLVQYDDQLTIVQLKDIKFSGNDERYIRKAFEDPSKQIHGAERSLIDLRRPVDLTNPFGHTHMFDPDAVNRVFRLVISVGDGNVPFNAVRDLGEKTIHVFDRSIETLLNELDTISDFNKYLMDKESLLARDDFISLTAYREVDLLGDYLYHGKSFDHLKELNAVHYEDGIWEEVVRKPEYIAKQKADSISYFWDHLIEFAHECPGEEYREIALELSRLNRFERRCASETFFDAHSKAENRGIDFRRTWEMNGATYVYLFTPPDRKRSQRLAQLRDVCTVARHKLRHNAKVIGIATEIGSQIPHSYDFVFMDFPEWSAENQKLAADLQKEHSILVNPTLSPTSFEEYPDREQDEEIASRQPDVKLPKSSKRRIGRNEPCPCGSGKKFKKCCGRS